MMVVREPKNPSKFFTCPYPIPKNIARIFNLVVLYTNFYIQICDEIFGGFLDQPQFISAEQEFRAQVELQELLETTKSLVMPFWNFWPIYKKQEDYEEDKALSDIFLSQKKKSLLIKFMQ
jgi:hypothetical protein